MDKEVVKEHAQWWQPVLNEKIDTQTRKDPGESFFLDGAGPALSAWLLKSATVSGDAKRQGKRSVCMRTLRERRRKRN